MKKYFLLAGFLIFALASCKKGDPPFDTAAQAGIDDGLIQAYLKNNPTITATKDASGLYYQIIDPGTGTHPTANSNITIGYTATLISGTTPVENNPSIYFNLSTLIQGWKIGIPLIGKGGTILLIVPSGLGYGNADNGSIPANTVVIFKITLQGFNNTTSS